MPARSRRGQINPVEPTDFTAKQQAFVREYVQSGGKLTQAAIAAGYSEASAASSAWQAMRNPLIQQAIYQETRAAFVQHAPAMQAVVQELALSSKSQMVRLLAAQDWLDRAGFRPVEQHQHILAGELKVSIDLGLSEGGPKRGDTSLSKDLYEDISPQNAGAPDEKPTEPE